MFSSFTIYTYNKLLFDEVFVIAGIIKAEADNTYQDLDYSGYHKKWNLIETAKSVKSLGLKDNATNQIRMKIYSVHIQTAWVETKTVKE